MIKDILRRILNFLHLDITKNLEYDRLTKLVLKELVREDSNTADIGCHKGEILNMLLQMAPKGKHAAFEPLPVFYQGLQKKFGQRVKIYPYALSDKSGHTTFHFVKNAPAFSGIKKRSYLVSSPVIEELSVEMKKLDEVWPMDLRLDFIKIDVEGGELDVMKGAAALVKKYKPAMVFEFGLGSSDHYGAGSKEMYEFLVVKNGLRLNTLKGFLRKGKPLSEGEFSLCFSSNKEYYFVAYP